MKYQLLEPSRLRIRQPHGDVQSIGFGIGEFLKVVDTEEAKRLRHPMGTCLMFCAALVQLQSV